MGLSHSSVIILYSEMNSCFCFELLKLTLAFVSYPLSIKFNYCKHRFRSSGQASRCKMKNSIRGNYQQFDSRGEAEDNEDVLIHIVPENKCKF